MKENVKDLLNSPVNQEKKPAKPHTVVVLVFDDTLSKTKVLKLLEELPNISCDARSFDPKTQEPILHLRALDYEES